MHNPSQTLLKKAIFTLINNYDLDEDSFFVVMTKDGKNPELAVADQTIIGELNLKSLVAFMVQAINQYCATANLNPHVFIARYLSAMFIEQDRLRFFDLLGGSVDDFAEELSYDEEDFGEELDAEADDDEVIYITNPNWDDIKN